MLIKRIYTKRREKMMKGWIRKSMYGSLLLSFFMLAGFVAAAYAADLPGKGVKVQPVDQGLIEEQFQYEILIEGLKRLGYEVKPILHMAGEVTTAHLAVGRGDADFYAVHWDPLHLAFYQKSGGEKALQRIGELTPGALQGYLIDKKTADKYNITNIEQLKDPEIAKLFDADGDGKADLCGCNPGWGCERVIEHQLTAYDLRDTVEHNQGTYFALIADTISRYKAGEPILYYTWTPMWVSGVLVPGEDVTWLSVPFTSLPGERTDVDTSMPDGTNTGFAVNLIRVIANKRFLDENPAAKKFFELAKIPVNDVSAENILIRDGEKTEKDVKRHAMDWIAKHQAEFDGWIEAAKKAAQ
jgi:glycine betaine/proline transport system substrate-binding protein